MNFIKDISKKMVETSARLTKKALTIITPNKETNKVKPKKRSMIQLAVQKLRLHELSKIVTKLSGSIFFSSKIGGAGKRIASTKKKGKAKDIPNT